MLDVRYLFHFMSVYVERLRKMSVGGVIKYIKLGHLTDATIPVPPLDEQRRIAEILDKADALRAKRRAALAQLDTLTQSVFLDMFGNPGTNPKGWRRATLGDVIFSCSDGPHVSPAYVEEGVPFLSTRHVRAGAVTWDDLKFITEADAEFHWKKCKPQRGDILYTKGGTTGLAAAVRTDRPFAIWVHIALLKPNPAMVESTWLESMLNNEYCYRQSQKLTHGIANRDLGLTRMVRIQIYLPPLSAQRQFGCRASAIDAHRSKQSLSGGQLDALFVSLQHRAFRGELLS
jgi:type I restriction enzyme S subunit